ncbi:hypothetical protein ACHAWO_000846 [Cyclotella atomus]|uniref:Uncharacterized protein n=1 Tax=Cyclotella atomus TaxID=382360 RepID=A0ABD3N936_9STRA
MLEQYDTRNITNLIILYTDNLGQMCFNAAKICQLQHFPHPVNIEHGWYNPIDFFTVDTLSGPQVYEMIGVGEYRLQRATKALVLQIIVPGGNDHYIGFNSAKGANAQNVEASDMVTIVEWHTTDVNRYVGYYLKGYRAQDESFLLGNGITVTAQCINTAVTPSIACVCGEERSQICPSDCACPAPIYQQLEITAINQAGACQETADETC